MQTATQTLTNPAAQQDGDIIYRFQGRLGDLYPVGIFPEGIRFHNSFEAEVVAGPFAGGRIFGIDHFLLRPDGVGVIIAPEVVEKDGTRVVGEVRGYVVPPAGIEMPPLEVIASPGFQFPDLDFRVTASVTLRTAAPAYDYLNRTVGAIEGTVNMSTGRLKIEARAQ